MKELLEMIAKALVDHLEQVGGSVGRGTAVDRACAVRPSGRRWQGDWSACAHSRGPPYDFRCSGHEAAEAR
jgi:hypothetical protein